MGDETDLSKLKRELLIRGYSPSTIRKYLQYNRLYQNYLNGKPSSEESIKDYLAYCIGEKRLEATSINLIRAAILFYYNDVLGQKNVVSAPKLKKKLPVYLTKEELQQILENTPHLKSKTLILMLYSSGMRLSEVLNLKKDDIDFENNRAKILGKGNKERTIIFSEQAAKTLKKYIYKAKISDRIFDISPRNVEIIVQKAAKRAGIKKHITPHKLRHSFATHLLQEGVSIRVIQVLLGHSNLQTTQIYTSVADEEIAKVKAPSL